MTAIPMPSPNPAPTPNPGMPLPAPSVLVMGDPGAGKTYSIITLLEAGLEVFIIATDPRGLDTILDQVRLRGNALMNKLHWSQNTPGAAGWNALITMANTVTRLSFADMANLKTGIEKQHTIGYLHMLETCKEFVCDRTQQSYGDVTEWDDTRVLVIDSLSGVNKLAMDQTIGYKPIASQSDWGVAMKLEEQLIYALAADCKCYFVVMAHIDKLQDGVTGMMNVTAAALGNKLSPQLIKLFSEVVLAKREGDKFYWSTSELNTTVKNRALPINAKLPPDFRPIISAHEARKLSLVA